MRTVQLTDKQISKLQALVKKCCKVDVNPAVARDKGTRLVRLVAAILTSPSGRKAFFSKPQLNKIQATYFWDDPDESYQPPKGWKLVRKGGLTKIVPNKNE